MSNSVLEAEEELFNLIDSHYSSHSFIVNDNSVDALHRRTLQDLNLFQDVNGCIPLMDYLHEEWYNIDSFNLWGRRNYSKIPLDRTTMLVEAHWSVLKRSLLQNYNRPRVDMLVFVIEKVLLPKIELEMKQLILGTRKPH